MKTKLILLAVASVASSQLCMAQTNQLVVEDFKPSSLNQPGQQYPQVNYSATRDFASWHPKHKASA
jgi:hypothetical protein